MFRFESMCLKDAQYEEVVSEAWERGKSMGTQHLLCNVWKNVEGHYPFGIKICLDT